MVSSPDPSVSPATVATELVLRRELQAVLADLDAAGVRTLVFKGAALAFTHYPTPAARPRIDADLLIAPQDRERATGVLERRGYLRPLRIPGELIRSQILFEKTDAFAICHAVDLHWKICKPKLFADVLSFDELWASAVRVPDLGPSARVPGPVHALAVACVHRVAHHHGAARHRRIWLYDIHLLAGRLSADETRQFLALAAAREIARVCADGIALAQASFGTRLSAGLLERLHQISADQSGAPSARYLEPRLRRVDVLASDLATLGSWRQRAALLHEHLFPPASYMREKYGRSIRLPLAWLYLRRVVEGALGWFVRDRTT